MESTAARIDTVCYNGKIQRSIPGLIETIVREEDWLLFCDRIDAGWEHYRLANDRALKEFYAKLRCHAYFVCVSFVILMAGIFSFAAPEDFTYRTRMISIALFALTMYGCRALCSKPATKAFQEELAKNYHLGSETIERACQSISENTSNVLFHPVKQKAFICWLDIKVSCKGQHHAGILQNGSSGESHAYEIQTV